MLSDATAGGGTETQGSWPKAATGQPGASPVILRKVPARKEIPLATGCLFYFPDALQAVAWCSYVGNEQHNPGTPMHWDRTKSGDEADALMRHLALCGTRDTDGIRHTAKVAWRALALLQKEIEAGGGL